MLITADGLVISRREFGEASCYIDILTKEYGVIEAVAHNVKKLNSRNSSACTLFTYASFCLNKNKMRYTVNSAKNLHSFHRLSSDIVNLSLAVYFAETVKYASSTEQHSGEVLRLMLISLYELCGKALPSAVKPVFELRLTSELGFAPDLTACRVCACYGHESMYFSIDEGSVTCGDCYDELNRVEGGLRRRLIESTPKPEGGCFVLSPPVLKGLRHSIYSPLEKVYKQNRQADVSRGLTATNGVLSEVTVIAEEYLLYHLGRGFKSLEYYNSLIKSLFRNSE